MWSGVGGGGGVIMQAKCWRAHAAMNSKLNVYFPVDADSGRTIAPPPPLIVQRSQVA